MSRKINADPPEFPNGGDLCRKGYESREYEISLVTPMFGGGVEAGAVDDSMPIRGTSIRGQLRFWWRATRGKKFSDPKDLAKEEGLIWGTTDHASPVSVEVINCKNKDIRLCDRNYDFNRFGPEAYALFSAKQNENDLCKEGLNFCLKVDWRKNVKVDKDKYKEISEDILMALKAWINFGGLGARTRRGVGGLFSTHPDLLLSSEDELGIFGFDKIYIGRSCSNAMNAWKKSLEVYQNFRQGFRGAKHEKELRSGKVVRVPGRSFWPEPDSLRQISGCSLKPRGSVSSNIPDDVNVHDHSRPIVPQEALLSFPRAALGLPINFHFADGPGNKAQRGAPFKDPGSCQLLPLKGDRMASPVITKPLCISGKWYPSIIIVDRTHAINLKVRLEYLNTQGSATKKISKDQVCGESVRGCVPLDGHDNALDALMAFSERNSFREVKA